MKILVLLSVLMPVFTGVSSFAQAQLIEAPTSLTLQNSEQQSNNKAALASAIQKEYLEAARKSAGNDLGSREVFVSHEAMLAELDYVALAQSRYPQIIKYNDSPVITVLSASTLDTYEQLTKNQAIAEGKIEVYNRFGNNATANIE